MLTILFYIIYLFYFKKTCIISVWNRFSMSKNIGIGALFVKLGQNGEVQGFTIWRQPGNRAWPITRYPKAIALSNHDACGIILAF